MTLILIDIRPEDGPVWYTSEQRNFLVNYWYERCFPFPGHRAPTTHYTDLYGFIQQRVTRAGPPSPTVSSLEAQPLGRVPPLSSPPAAASSRYVNPSPKSKVCLCLQALADTTICRWILGMALIREIHYIWDEMVAREMERRLILLQQSDNESRSWLLKACPVLIRD
jgi:hypothetical protein